LTICFVVDYLIDKISLIDKKTAFLRGIISLVVSYFFWVRSSENVANPNFVYVGTANDNRTNGITRIAVNIIIPSLYLPMKLKSSILFFTLILSISFASTAQELLPTSTTGQIYKHTNYSLSYSEADEQAEWVYYELTAEMVRGKQPRTDDYRPDSTITTVSAQLEDYRGSGYDRGHLCPAGDMKLNHVSMSESFYLSNCSPQDRDFNAGIWNDLENKVRSWAINSGSLYVVTAGILTSNKGKIGSNEVTIPKCFYKVLYDPRGQGKMIAFILANENSTKPLQEFVVTVDSLESLTGIDFFPALPDSLENRLESRTDLSGWFRSK
jgi:endonuclease G, mitochondrial